jgi:hypothetical protein
MSRGQMRGQRHVADGDALAVPNDAIDVDRRKTEPGGIIVGVAPRQAAFERHPIAGAGREPGVRIRLDPRQGADVIAVRMVADDPFDRRKGDADGLDIVLDERRILRDCSVDQDGPAGRGDEIGRQAPCADIVDVRRNGERLDRLGPCRRLRRRRGRRGNHAEQRRGKPGKRAGHCFSSCLHQGFCGWALWISSGRAPPSQTIKIGGSHNRR